MSPSAVPARPPRITTHVARRGGFSHGKCQLANHPNFDLDSRAAIFCQTVCWKFGEILGWTFHEAKFFRSSSSICVVKHRGSKKPSRFEYAPARRTHQLQARGRKSPQGISWRRASVNSPNRLENRSAAGFIDRHKEF